jgi:phage gp36-like protein
MYSTLADITDRIPEENLIQLTDDESLGAVNEARVSSAIGDADVLIDGYLRGRYPLPLDPVPALIKKLSIDIAVFNIYSRKLELEMPDAMSDRYKNAVKVLEHIQSGKISLGTSEGNTPEPGEYQTNKTSTDRMFPKTVLDGF